ncbi:DUF547 domain-containing protein [Halorientalis sp.]|uniref:DUF547 domain-containing protein n=1 Tax=Halorientalis sp. TaxID=1931229 RepID=UPI002622FEA9|nr:DUF547 domain-containing protein [Halorientalis sp.]
MSDRATPVGDETVRQGEISNLTPTACARRLLTAVRTDESPDPYLARLAEYDAAALEPLRADPGLALAFWSNCYNAGTQLLLSRRPELYESSLRFLRFFRATAVTVAGTDLSLDAIEHGLLRGARTKYGLGYLPRVLAGRFERRYRLSDPDPRVHFALNCGAASCPAIRAYEADRIDDQLDLATQVYLDASVDYDSDADVVTVPKLFLWYRGDFGGGSGIRDLLRTYDAIPADANPRLRHRDWDWSRAAGKFVD